MNARGWIAAHGLVLALGLASVASGQPSPAAATPGARQPGWATLFAAPGPTTPARLKLHAVGAGIAIDTERGSDPLTPPSVPVEARPPPRPTLEPRRAAPPADDARVTVEEPTRYAAVFFDVFGGTERRVRPTDATNRAFAVGSPLVGLKFGVARRFPDHWELAGSLGAAIRLVAEENRVNRSSLFAEAEVNRYLARGVFIGTGLSLWALTRSDIWTPAWLLHVGIPLSRSARHPVFLVGEGRLFFRRIDDATNNYEIWGGVQVRLRR